MDNRLLIKLWSTCIQIVLIAAICTEVSAAELAVEKMLPSPECTDGWAMTEKPAVFSKDNLFERINGEAEIYFPYGFDLMASARYQNKQDPGIAIDADVYRMGSLLDAFGIYAGYRRADDPPANVGADSALSDSQLLFYQDRYFVRLQATGALEINKNKFLACAAAISQRIGTNRDKPVELKPFMLTEVDKRSERYIAQSMLGYTFLRRGIIADARSSTGQFQVFVVYTDSDSAALKAFDQYVAYLRESGKDVELTGPPLPLTMIGADPLYGKIFIRRHGRYLIGVVRFSDASEAKRLAEKIKGTL
jgi:hypothetical protein